MTNDEDGSGSESRALTTLLDKIDFVFCILPLAMAVMLSFILAMCFLAGGVLVWFVWSLVATMFFLWILHGVFVAASAPRDRPMPVPRRVSVCVRLGLLILLCLLGGVYLMAGGQRLGNLAVGVGFSFPAMIAGRHLLLIYLGVQKGRLRG